MEKKKNAHLEQENTRLLSVNEKLKNEILYLRRLLFGRSSERYIKEDPNQLKLDFGGEDTLTQEAQTGLEAAKETITYERKKKKEPAVPPVRQPLPAHLERKEETIEPDPSARRFKIDGRGSDGSPGIYTRNVGCKKVHILEKNITQFFYTNSFFVQLNHYGLKIRRFVDE
ncbi:MAG: transposase [Tannerella sp.]|nr:transposase [Tannerella sp.]